MKKFGFVIRICGIVLWALGVFLGFVVMQPLSKSINIGGAINTWAAVFVVGAMYYAVGMLLETLADMYKHQSLIKKNQEILAQNQAQIAANQEEDKQWQEKVDKALAPM